MSDEHTAAWKAGIPSLPLSVLYEIVFIAVPFVVDDERLSTGNAGLDVRHHGIARELHGVIPTAKHPLIGRIAGREERAAIVVARIHQVPVAHTEVALVEDVVHVGETHAMGKLMADGADAFQIAKSIHFVAACKLVDGDTVEAEGLPVVRLR